MVNLTKIGQHKNLTYEKFQHVSATHLQIRITLQTNMFIVNNERVLCWGRTPLVLEMDTFHAGDEHFSTGDEHVENTRLRFNHKHTYPPATSKQNLC